MSENFGTVDLAHLPFPTKMRVDWIRVYQPKNAINIGCDPKDFPTAAYINRYAYYVLHYTHAKDFPDHHFNRYIEAYTNPNLTTWVDDYKQTFPKNRFKGEC